jgi:hypothetical protein
VAGARPTPFAPARRAESGFRLFGGVLIGQGHGYLNRAIARWGNQFRRA